MKVKEKQQQNLIPQEAIQNKIIVLRSKKVMVDRDLAILYEVETRILNQAVKRNIERFPENFMFQLTKEEMENWKSQIVISTSDKMGLRYKPLAFTEQGVAMLSSALNSKRAIQVNIAIINAFVKMREMFEDFNKNREAIEKMKRDNDERFIMCYKILDAHSKDIKTIYKLLSSPEELEKDEIGFKG